MNEFDEWWKYYNSNNTTCMDDLKAAFKAGAAAMREKAADICESVTRQCTYERADYCTGWNASECPDKDITLCAATAIRKIEVD